MKIFNSDSDQKKSLRGAYHAMMQMPAWEDLESFAMEEREGSIKRLDAKSASNTTQGEFCEERGFRKGLMKLIQHAEQCREGV
jgi:hypothetical protein